MQTPEQPEKIPDDVLAQIDAKLGEIEQLAAPYIRSLADEQRRGGGKLGPASVDFVGRAIAGMDAKGDVLSARFDKAAFKNAFDVNRQFAPLVTRFDAVARALDDTEMWAGMLAYEDALKVYHDFGKEVHDDSSLAPYYDAMAERFANLRGKRNPPKP